MGFDSPPPFQEVAAELVKLSFIVRKSTFFCYKADSPVVNTLDLVLFLAVRHKHPDSGENQWVRHVWILGGELQCASRVHLRDSWLQL